MQCCSALISGVRVFRLCTANNCCNVVPNSDCGGRWNAPVVQIQDLKGYLSDHRHQVNSRRDDIIYDGWYHPFQGWLDLWGTLSIKSIQVTLVPVSAPDL